MSTDHRASSLSVALPKVVGNFTKSLNHESNPINHRTSYRDDIYGNFAIACFRDFMVHADRYAKKHEAEMTSAERGKLIDRLGVAQLGIGDIAMFSEVCVLKGLQDDTLDIDVSAASDLITNSYPFIQSMLDGGSVLGATISRHFLKTRSSIFEDRIIEGVIRDGRLASPGRLGMFSLNHVSNGRDSVIPVALEATVADWIRTRGEPPQQAITCPAEINRQTKTNIPFTRVIFDAMVKHQEKHILPGYIPYARKVLADY